MSSAGLGLDGTHAARYGASEFLKDRHPDLSEPFPKGVIEEEIAIAFGRRHVPKLVDVISLPDDRLPTHQLATALRYLLSLLSNQETKCECVTYDSAPFLVHHLTSEDPYVRQLSALTLASLAQLMLGRAEVVASQGIPSLTEMLEDADPEARAAASYCLEMVSSGPEGASAVLSCESKVLQKEVEMLEDPITTDEAQLSAVLTLTNCTTCDGGIYQALDAQVPPTLLRLASAQDSNDEMRIAIARCLRNMAHHPYGKVQVFEAGAIPVLTTFLQSENELLQQCAAACLMGLTVEEDAKLPTVEAAGSDLVEMLHHPNPDVAENVLATIHNSCEDMQARKIIEGLLGDDDREFIFCD
mmetsp:Transcript_26183/g.56787  ORF Transcript_26183/g.56787 Transcript_26183/m.56787 type:complete len:357 (-) Transcript_26183:77-1147(-)|eukprot:CAMPEP_0118925706 /NCGR_PEP_ID=MMETSP1169-20130426/3554_1 /TAXON_ID=36882 /ORGANISM="Pyramimonas obovata, Strain CCMP722" /LENGTH=356 /DNA_ID=CAMNT_0006867081 /DNA_START=317 /DNA_END=1387 /DNA_ORIENTATION=-